MKIIILKVFLSLAFLALSGWCYANPTIIIKNISSTQSVFVISNCTIGNNPYTSPLTTSTSATSNFAQGTGGGTYYYIGKGGSNSLTWTVPSTKCVMEIPGINSYLYFDSTGVMQQGSGSSGYKYVLKYAVYSSSISWHTLTTGLQYYTVSYGNSYSSYPNDPTVTFNFFDYGTNIATYTGAAGATCGINGMAYDGYACTGSTMCWCPWPNQQNTTCSCTNNGAKAVCSNNASTPYQGSYASFSCPSGTGCYCDGAACTCTPNGKGASCGGSAMEAYANFPCASGTTCTMNTSTFQFTCQ